MHEVLAVARRHGVRVHVDAAYGGFFTLLAGADGPAGLDPAPWRAIADCDSVVVDPHKHGLQPYGCGAVLFADPDVGRFYLHDSPVHLLHLRRPASRRDQPGVLAGGRERGGAWLTFRLLPLTAGRARPGAGRRPAQAALAWAELLRASAVLDLYQQPELDIVTYFPAAPGLPEVQPSLAAIDAAPGLPEVRPSLAAIDAASAAMLHRGMTDRRRRSS